MGGIALRWLENNVPGMKTITIELSDPVYERVVQEAGARLVTPSQYAREAIEQRIPAHSDAPAATNGNAAPLWQIAEELAAAVPASEWEGVPTNAAMNLDHYLYGAPKVS